MSELRRRVADESGNGDADVSDVSPWDLAVCTLDLAKLTADQWWLADTVFFSCGSADVVWLIPLGSISLI